MIKTEFGKNNKPNYKLTHSGSTYIMFLQYIHYVYEAAGGPTQCLLGCPCAFVEKVCETALKNL